MAAAALVYNPKLVLKVFGIAFFGRLFWGFMLLPCLNTLASIFITPLLVNAFPGVGPDWFSGLNAVLFTMTFITGSCAMSAIVLLAILSSCERKGYYLSRSRTKANFQKQKIKSRLQC